MAKFVGASSQRLTATPLITAAPFTVGAWLRPATSGTDENWCSIANAAGAGSYFSLYKGTTNLWGIEANTSSAAIEAGAITANAWQFVLCRIISATNRRIAVVQSNGLMAHGQNVNSQTPTGLTEINLGCINTSSSPHSFFTGDIAEWWISAADPVPGGVQIPDPLLWSLAWNGPFSSNLIAGSIIEYRSFRSNLGSTQENGHETFFGRSFRHSWANNGGVSVGEFPPLPGSYIRPQRVVPALLV